MVEGGLCRPTFGVLANKNKKMNIRFLILILLAVSILSFRQPAAESKVEWLTPDSFDFGDVTRNKPVSHEFRFRNLSGQALIVDNVRTSCGCTVPDWDKAAVPPDSVGIISVEYDARSLGYFLKKVKVYFNGQRRAEVLYIEGDVVGE